MYLDDTVGQVHNMFMQFASSCNQMAHWTTLNAAGVFYAFKNGESISYCQFNTIILWEQFKFYPRIYQIKIKNYINIDKTKKQRGNKKLEKQKKKKKT